MALFYIGIIKGLNQINGDVPVVSITGFINEEEVGCFKYGDC